MGDVVKYNFRFVIQKKKFELMYNIPTFMYLRPELALWPFRRDETVSSDYLIFFGFLLSKPLPGLVAAGSDSLQA